MTAIAVPPGDRRRLTRVEAATAAAVAAIALVLALPSVRHDAPSGYAASGATATEVAWQAPPADATRLHDRMLTTADGFDRAADGRGAFLRVYARMTGGTIDHLGEGFEDPAWVRALMVAFGARYFDAVGHAEAGEDELVPPPWYVAFKEADPGAPAALKDVLLGMNAHINYDLALATRDVLVAEAEARDVPFAIVAESRGADFRQIDSVIAAIIPDVLQDLERFGPSRLGPLGRTALRRPDLGTEWATGIAAWRADAWDAAVALAGRDGANARHRVWELGEDARNWAHFLVGVEQVVAATADRLPVSLEVLFDRTSVMAAWMRGVNRSGVRLPSPG